MRRAMGQGVLLAVPAILLATAAWSQETFRSEANLVLVRFSAMLGNRFLTGIQTSDILITEDGKPQAIAVFEGPERSGPHRGEADFHILIDISGSVTFVHALDVQLIRRCLIEQVSDRTAVTIFAFAYQCRKLTGPTLEASEIEKALDQLVRIDLGQARPSASFLYEAIIEVAGRARPAAQALRPTLIVFSDGLDTGDRTASDALQALDAAGMTVFPVVLVPFPVPRNLQVPRDFVELGSKTGGRAFQPPAFTPEALQRILSHVANHVRAEYTVGYYATNAAEGRKYRSVAVRLKRPDGAVLYGGVRSIPR